MELKIKRQKLSDESLNDKDYVVLNDGINWDRYKKNPILLWDHNPREPIGNVVNIRRGEDGDWYGELRFDGVTEQSRQRRDQYLAGTLRAVSLSGKIYYTLRDGIKYATRFDVYEISLLSLPSNANAVDEVEGAEPALRVGFCAVEAEELESLTSGYTESLTKYLNKMKEENQTAEVEKTAEAKGSEAPQEQAQEQFAAAAQPAEAADAGTVSETEKFEGSREGALRAFNEFLRLIGIRGAEAAKADSDMAEEDRKAAEEVRDAEKKEEDDDDDDDDGRKERGENFASSTTEQPKPAARILNVEETVEKSSKTNVQFSSAMERKTIHEYLRDNAGKDRFSEAVRFSAAVGKMNPNEAAQDSRMNLLREFAYFAAKDRGFRAAVGGMNFDIDGRPTGTADEALNRLEQFASGLNSMNFIETTPDLAKIEWSTMIFRVLFPDDSWADRISRLSADDVAGIIWITSAIKPKVYFGKRAPVNVSPSLYDDDPVGIIMRLFALENIVWQQANTDLLAYDDVALGTSEALRWLSSKAHNYIIQKLSEDASVKHLTTGEKTYSATNAFPANPKATGTLKEIAPADFLAMQTAFINQNYVMETFAAEMVMPGIMHQQLQSNATLTNLLTKNAGSMRPMFGEYAGFVFRPRSITTLYDSASSKIIDPELYLDGKITDETGAIPTYTPPVIPATAYGSALAFIPSEAIIAIGRTNVHMVTDPSNYGWRMSMDMRLGAGAARKGGLGIGVIAPGTQD